MPPDRSLLRTIRGNLAIGLGLCAVLGAATGVAAMVQISGAVIATGRMVVETNVKKVQHPQGGIVGEVLVRNGSRVKAGDVVLRLDATAATANRAIAETTLIELYTRRTRLEAERDDAVTLIWPADLVLERTSTFYTAAIRAEERHFELRRLARAGQKAQLRERIQQGEQQIAGLAEQVESKGRELDFITHEVKSLRELFERKLVALTRVTALERDLVRIRGERGRLVAEIASTKGRIAETELQILQVDQDLRSEVARELQEVYAKIAEASQKRIAAEDQLKRIEVVAPQDGTVHQLVAHGPGAVVGANEQVMQIVPNEDVLIVEARVEPQVIDQVRLGHPALFRLTSFHQRTTPELAGRVVFVSPDATRDQRTGRPYFNVRMSIAPGESDKLAGQALMPGMPVEAFIKTGDRAFLTFLVKPMMDQITQPRHAD